MVSSPLSCRPVRAYLASRPRLLLLLGEDADEDEGNTDEDGEADTTDLQPMNLGHEDEHTAAVNNDLQPIQADINLQSLTIAGQNKQNKASTSVWAVTDNIALQAVVDFPPVRGDEDGVAVNADLLPRKIEEADGDLGDSGDPNKDEGDLSLLPKGDLLLLQIGDLLLVPATNEAEICLNPVAMGFAPEASKGLDPDEDGVDEDEFDQPAARDDLCARPKGKSDAEGHDPDFFKDESADKPEFGEDVEFDADFVEDAVGADDHAPDEDAASIDLDEDHAASADDGAPSPAHVDYATFDAAEADDHAVPDDYGFDTLLMAKTGFVPSDFAGKFHLDPAHTKDFHAAEDKSNHDGDAAGDTTGLDSIADANTGPNDDDAELAGNADPASSSDDGSVDEISNVNDMADEAVDAIEYVDVQTYEEDSYVDCVPADEDFYAGADAYRDVVGDPQKIVEAANTLLHAAIDDLIAAKDGDDLQPISANIIDGGPTAGDFPVESLFTPLWGSKDGQAREKFLYDAVKTMKPKARVKMKAELQIFYLTKCLLDPGI